MQIQTKLPLVLKKNGLSGWKDEYNNVRNNLKRLII